jgi:hypothetical protein
MYQCEEGGEELRNNTPCYSQGRDIDLSDVWCKNEKIGFENYPTVADFRLDNTFDFQMMITVGVELLVHHQICVSDQSDLKRKEKKTQFSFIVPLNSSCQVACTGLKVASDFPSRNCR